MNYRDHHTAQIWSWWEDCAEERPTEYPKGTARPTLHSIDGWRRFTKCQRSSRARPGKFEVSNVVIALCKVLIHHERLFVVIFLQKMTLRKLLEAQPSLESENRILHVSKWASNSDVKPRTSSSKPLLVQTDSLNKDLASLDINSPLVVESMEG